MAEKSQKTSTGSNEDIDLDPILQGADRVQGKKERDSRLNETVDDDAQDTQTRSNIHMGGRHSEGEGFMGEDGKAFPSSSTDATEVQGSPVHTSLEQAEAKLSDVLRDNLEGEDEGTGEEGNLGSGTATSELMFEEVPQSGDSFPSEAVGTVSSEQEFSAAESPLRQSSTQVGGNSEATSPDTDGDETVNSAPVAHNDQGATDENASFSFNVLANDTDVDNNNLFIVNAEMSEGLGAILHDGKSITFNPGSAYDYLADGDTASVEITYTVSDGKGGFDTASMTITVTGSNDGPVAVADSFGGSEDQDITGTVLANDTDVDGDSLSVVAETIMTAQGGTVEIAADGTFSYSPAADYHGPDSFSYTLTDGTTTDTGSVTLSVSGENDGPVVGNIDLGSTLEDTGLSFTGADLLANSSDIDGDSLSVTAVTVDPAYGTVSDHGDGTYSFTPAADYHGADVPLSFTVSDGLSSSSATASLEVTAVNDGPVAAADVAEASENQTITVDVLSNDTDVDGDSLSLTGVSVADNSGSVSIVDGAVAFNPGSDFDGLAEGETQEVVVTYDIADGNGGTASSTVTITVTGSNDGPVAVTDSFGGSEDQDITGTVLANDTDVDGDSLSVVAETIMTAQGGTVEIAADGTFSYSPAADYHGPDSFSYTLTDGTTTDTGSVTLSVSGENDGPVVGNIDLGSTLEDTGLSFTGADLLANSSDIDGDSLSVTAVTVDPAYGTVSDHGDGTYSFTPAADYHGADVPLSFTVSDGLSSSSATASLEVTAVNDGPVAAADVAEASENQTITVDVLSNDTDVDGDSLSLTGVSVADNSGSVSIVDGAVAFNPGSDFDGLAEGETQEVVVTYDIADGNGGTASSTVTITVTGSNDGPVAVADSFGGSEDQDITGTVLANDTDVDGDSLSVVAETIMTAQGGTVEIAADGTFSYSPAADYHGPDSFSYTLTDGTTTDTGSVTLSVSGENDGPVVGNIDLGSTLEDTGLSFTGADLLANSSDIDGDSLSVTAVTVDPAYGTVSDHGDGTYSFTPAADYHGADVPLSFTVSDGLSSSSATASLEVTAVNDGPVAAADVAEASENQTITVDVLSNDTDVDGDSLSLTGVSVADNSGSVSIVDGAVAFNPGSDFDGLAEGETQEVVVTYDIADGNGGTASSTVTITVTGSNDGPVAVADSFGGSEDQDITGTVLANDTDVDGDSLSVVAETIMTAQGGTVEIAADGTFSYSPAADYHGPDSFSYTLTDGTTTDTGSVTLSVSGENDGPVVGNIDLGSTLEDTGLSFTGADLLANSSDIDGDSLSVTAVTVDPAYGTVSDHGDGTYSFTPAADYHGADVPLSFTVSDGLSSSSATASLEVTAVNDGPVAAADVAEASENQTITVDVLSNDTDVDGDSLSLTGVSVADNSGSVSIVDGAVAFNPGSDFEGLAEGETQEVVVTYDIADGNGGTASSTVTITVTGSNDGPVAVTDSFGGSEDQDITGTVLANDTDVDGDSLSVVAETIMTAQGGTVEIAADGTFSYSPAADYHGPDSFSYTLTDGTTTDTGSVTLSVSGENDGPVVGNIDLGSTLEDTGLSFTGADLLANSSDIDGDSLSVTAVTVDPAYGTVSDHGDGTYSFTPAADYHGADVPLSFTVSDGLSSSSATASLEVTAVADAPNLDMSTELTADHGLYDISAGGEVTIDVDYLTVNAGYKSSHGFYVADAEGHPIGGAIIQDNVKDYDSHSVTINTDDYPGGVTVGFFIIPNGENKNVNLSDGDQVTFEQINGVWTPMHEGSSLSGQGAPAYFSSQALNPDGYDHFADSSGAGNQNWEDLYGGGDMDHTDVNTQVTVTINSDPHLEGAAGEAISLPDISASLNDNDGSESLGLEISAIPEGAVLSDGNGHSFTAASDNTQVDVSSWDLDNLTITPVSGTPDFNLKVTATSTEGSNGDTATISQDISVDILGQTIEGTNAAEDLTVGSGNDTIMYNADGTWKGYSAHNVETGEYVSLKGLNSTDDVFDGGDGYDVLQGTDGDDALFLDDSVNSFATTEQARIQNIEEINMGGGDDIVDMTSNSYSYDQGVIVDGGTGDDVLWTSTGDDTLKGGEGDDSLFGGDGNDTFIFGLDEGSDTVDGGAGWTDTVQLEGVSGESQQGWTLSLDNGSTVLSTDESASEMLLSDDASGSITFDDGGTVVFDNIEKIVW